MHINSNPSTHCTDSETENKYRDEIGASCKQREKLKNIYLQNNEVRPRYC